VWNLVEGVEDLSLYEALAKNSPRESAVWERHTADSVYLLGLIAANRVDEAAKFACDPAFRSQASGQIISGSTFKHLQRQGLGRQVLAFVQQLLIRDPSLPFWDDFIALSAQESHAETALVFLRETLSKPALSAPARREVQAHLYAALLGANEIDEGVRVIRELIEAGPLAGKLDAEAIADQAKKQFAQLGVSLSPEQMDSFRQRSFGYESDGRAALSRAWHQAGSAGPPA